jgi:hypothetical protein
MKTPQIYISRNYVEFGPFEGTEIAAFHARGIVTSDDHLHVIGSDTWVSAQEWLAKPAASAPKALNAKPKAAKAAVKKAVATKKKEKVAA